MIKNKMHSRALQVAVALLCIHYATNFVCAGTNGHSDKVFVINQPTPDACSEFLKRNAIQGVKDCKVSDAGDFGNIDGQDYQYILYCIIPSYSTEGATCGDESFTARYYRNRGLSILMQNVSSKQTELYLDRIIADIGIYIYEVPEIVQTAFGKIMHVPIKVDGTGNGNESEYYLWNDKLKKWFLLDSATWLQDLYKRVPKGFSINKGIWPDLETMTAKAWLYQKDDANCCPSGGTAAIELLLKDNRFLIKSIRYMQDEDE